MTEQVFKELNLNCNEFIMIHLSNGTTLHGNYMGNYDNGTRQFDFDNHTKGRREKITLDNIHSIIKGS